jgi:hypothetical protein
VQTLAARVPALIPLIYVEAILPGLVAAAMLLTPRGRRSALRVRTA